MKVVIVGSGYVGLVSGVCLAAKGHDVVCVDVNPDVVARLNLGIPHIYERGLNDLLADVTATGRFSASTDIAASLDGAVLAMIAVGTPSEQGVIDLRFVRSAARSIGEYIRIAGRYISVVVKSTVIPGTTDTVVREEIEATSGKKLQAFGLGMNPEFLREGEAIEDFMNPDRIVFGHEDATTLACLEELYAPWDCDKVRVNTRTAEMIKYANNSLLATQISAMNEIANLAANVGGIDVMDVVRGIQLDRRWSPIMATGRISPTIVTYLVPGCGFGGSCFPKDLQALRAQGVERGLTMDVLNAVLDVNDRQPHQVIDILVRSMGSLASRSCLLLGLAFKPETDDVRESPSLKIANDLVREGARLVAHDPVATGNFRKAVGAVAEEITFVDDWRPYVREADVIVMATRWEEYRELAQFEVAGKSIFDARRLLPAESLTGANYLSIGRRLV